MAKKTISSSVVLFGLAGLVVVGLISYVVYAAGQAKKSPASYEAFAQCLTDKGAKMYGAWWCSHCMAQKKLFGSSFEKVNYTECSSSDGKSVLPVCQEAGIKGYPTWKFADGTELSGEQSFATLAGKTGCVAPEATPTP